MKRIILALVLLVVAHLGFGREKFENALTAVKPKTTEPVDYYKKGFVSITELGVAFAGKTAVFSFNEVLGGRVSPHFGIGLGLGTEYGRGGFISFPITLDMRAYFLKKRVSPFINIAPGYQLNTVTSAFVAGISHNFVSNTGLGVEFKIIKQVGISLNGGYRLTVTPVSGSVFLGHGGYVRFGVVY